MKFKLLGLLMMTGIQAQEHFLWLSGSQSKHIFSEKEIMQIKEQYSFLNQSAYYIRDLQAIKDQYQELVFKDQENKQFKAYFFNRNAKNMVLVVPPYQTSIDKMVHFAALFSDYNIVIVEYESGSIQQALSEQFLAKKRARVKQIFEWVQSQKYTKIIACGQCYGARLLLELQKQLQEENKPRFDFFIIDSCPAEAHELAEKFIEDPVSVVTFGKRTTPGCIKLLLKFTPINYCMKKYAQSCFNAQSLASLFKNLSVPVLLFHGQQDRLISTEQFMQLYNVVPHENKKALITPYKHLYHSLKAKELYYQVINSFFEEYLL